MLAERALVDERQTVQIRETFQIAGLESDRVEGATVVVGAFIGQRANASQLLQLVSLDAFGRPALGILNEPEGPAKPPTQQQRGRHARQHAPQSGLGPLRRALPDVFT
jgi:hypothetical protein